MPSYSEDRSEAAKGNVKNIRENAANLAKNVSDEARTQMNSAKQEAHTMADTVNDKLKSVGVDTDVMMNSARTHMSELQKMLTDEVSNRPLRTLGIAAAVGAVLGMMTSRR